MSRFRDVYLDPCVLSYGVVGSPRFSTSILTVDSGAESAMSRWANPLHRFVIPEAVRNMEIYNSLLSHWMVMRGPAYTFPFRNPMDFASVELDGPGQVPTISGDDISLGFGNGTRTEFPLIKLYRADSYEYTRRIYLPVLSSLLVEIDGELTVDYTVDRPGGTIMFNAPPEVGDEITVGFLFDCEVRFESDDSLEGIARTFALGGFSDLTLIEVRPC